MQGFALSMLPYCSVRRIMALLIYTETMVQSALQNHPAEDPGSLERTTWTSKVYVDDQLAEMGSVKCKFSFTLVHRVMHVVTCRDPSRPEQV